MKRLSNAWLDLKPEPRIYFGLGHRSLLLRAWGGGGGVFRVGCVEKGAGEGGGRRRQGEERDLYLNI